MSAMRTDPWRQRVDSADWEAITAEVNSLGGAVLPPLVSPSEAQTIRELYGQPRYFRSTVDMGRHRFGEGEYRYFTAPYPEPIEQLKQALYPRLLPIARDWAARLGWPARWPELSTSGCKYATAPDRASRPRSCSAIRQGTGMRCTATCMATWSSRCRL
jgi:uncharacterized protein